MIWQCHTKRRHCRLTTECPHASEEGVAAAFAAGGGAGIRSLPNALVPGFREVLYAQLVGFGEFV